MNRLFLLISLAFIFANCKTSQKTPTNSSTQNSPLPQIFAAQLSGFDSILAHSDVWELQIIYTQIDRDEQQKPHFTTFTFGADSLHYFYPASMVKLPLALLSLEKINHLRRSGFPRLTRETPYQIDSVRAFQQKVVTKNGAPDSKPSIAQDIREIFAVSDNEAYNHLFEFLGRENINHALQEKGYSRTGIVHRFNFPGRANQWSSPIKFVDQTSQTIFSQPEKEDKNQWRNPQNGLKKGIGYLDSRDSLVPAPFDFSRKNWFSLHDMERMLRATIFPDAFAEQARFGLTADDYKFLYQNMGGFPRECPYPKYNEAEYSDGYCKFFIFGDSKAKQNGTVRSFNKVGEAYGTLTDVAYIVDFQNNVEFLLAATILCNRDGVFNDDKYDYETVGYPFLAKLGQVMLDFERKRTRKVNPDLSRLQLFGKE